MLICTLHARPQSRLALEQPDSQLSSGSGDIAMTISMSSTCHLRSSSNFKPGKTSHELSTEGPESAIVVKPLNRFSARSFNKDNNGRL